MSHIWEDQPLRKIVESNNDFQARGKQVALKIIMDFQVDESITSIRICAHCGQESVNYGETKESCDEILVRRIMES